MVTPVRGGVAGVYAPETPPDSTDPADIAAWAQRELARAGDATEVGLARNVEFVNVAPTKPREGNIRGADGTNWNPGGGKGIVAYYNSTWNKLMEWFDLTLYSTTAAMNAAIAAAIAAIVFPTQPVGSIMPWAGLVVPDATWDFCDGGTLSRSTNAALFAKLMKQATITVTIASPAVVTWTGHGLRTNHPIKFFTSGALPTGITAGTHGAYVGTSYYVKVIDANTFNIAATPGGANINTTGSQSGTHTGVCAPYGDGDGSTTFHKPDLKGRSPVGRDDQGGSAAGRVTNAGAGTSLIDGNVPGANGGEQAHVLIIAELAAHNHTVSSISGTGGTTISAGAFSGSGGSYTTQNTGSGTAHNNMQPTLICDYIIKIS